MAKKNPLRKIFTRGLVRENPLLILLLGTCPALAVTTSLLNGLGMGLSATFVLVCSNLVISLLRNVIPDRVRIPAYITVIASFVTLLQFMLEAYIPALNDTLGIFIPLITVNCIILGRAEAFAGKNKPLPSVIDGLGMGIGFTAALILIGGIREILGNGTLFNQAIPFVGGDYKLQPILIFILPPGGFFAYGFLIALAEKLNRKMYAARPDRALEDQEIALCTVADPEKVDCMTCQACGVSELKAAFDPPKNRRKVPETIEEKADAVKKPDVPTPPAAEKEEK